MKIAICDDEKMFVNRITELVIDYFQQRKIKIEVDTFLDPLVMLSSQEDYHIIFLDVDMPKLNGIQLGKQLRKSNRNAIIIYVSALVQYAFDGYSVHAFQYLLKRDLSRTFSQCMDDVMLQLPSTGSYFIPTDMGGFKALLADIIYFEIQNHTIIVHTRNFARDQWLFQGTISQIETQLEGSGFLRIHKSYLVNIRHILRMGKAGAEITTGEVLPCSRQKYNDLLTEYMLWEARE